MHLKRNSSLVILLRRVVVQFNGTIQCYYSVKFIAGSDGKLTQVILRT